MINKTVEQITREIVGCDEIEWEVVDDIFKPDGDSFTLNYSDWRVEDLAIEFHKRGKVDLAKLLESNIDECTEIDEIVFFLAEF